MQPLDEHNQTGAEARDAALQPAPGGGGDGTVPPPPPMPAGLEDDDCIRAIMRHLPTTRARCVALAVSPTWRAAGLTDPDLWRECVIIPYLCAKSLSDAQLDALIGRAGDRLEVLAVGRGSTLTAGALRQLKCASGLRRLALTSPSLSGADIIAALPPSLAALRDVEIDGCEVTASQLEEIRGLVHADGRQCEIDITPCSACSTLGCNSMCDVCCDNICYECCGPTCEICDETCCKSCAEDDDEYGCRLCSQCERFICGSCDEEEAAAAGNMAGVSCAKCGELVCARCIATYAYGLLVEKCEICNETRCYECADDGEYGCRSCSQCRRSICKPCVEAEATAAGEMAGVSCDKCGELVCSRCIATSYYGIQKCEICNEMRCYYECAEDDDEYDCRLCSQCERLMCKPCDEAEATAAGDMAVGTRDLWQMLQVRLPALHRYLVRDREVPPLRGDALPLVRVLYGALARCPCPNLCGNSQVCEECAGAWRERCPGMQGFALAAQAMASPVVSQPPY
jgi:hypothetical protein